MCDLQSSDMRHMRQMMAAHISYSKLMRNVAAVALFNTI